MKDTRLALALATSFALSVAARPAAAGTLKCLVGTDPSVADDIDRIVAVRGEIDFECPCEDFDGSAGATRIEYLKCVGATLDALVAEPATLRAQ